MRIYTRFLLLALVGIAPAQERVDSVSSQMLAEWSKKTYRPTREGLRKLSFVMEGRMTAQGKVIDTKGVFTWDGQDYRMKWLKAPNQPGMSPDQFAAEIFKTMVLAPDLRDLLSGCRISAKKETYRTILRVAGLNKAGQFELPVKELVFNRDNVLTTVKSEGIYHFQGQGFDMKVPMKVKQTMTWAKDNGLYFSNLNTIETDQRGGKGTFVLQFTHMRYGKFVVPVRLTGSGGPNANDVTMLYRFSDYKFNEDVR